MNILFYIQSQYDAKLADLLIPHMKDRIGARKFGVVTYRQATEGRFFRFHAKNKFDIVLTETELWHEAMSHKVRPDNITLKRLEHDYGIPTLWQYLTHDRNLIMRRFGSRLKEGTKFSRAELLVHIQTRFLSIERLVEEFKPDAIIYIGVDVGPSLSLILNQVAAKKGIPVIVPMHTRIGSFISFKESVFSRSRVIESRYYHFQASDLPEGLESIASNIVDQIREGALLPSYFASQTGQFEQRGVKRTAKLNLKEVLDNQIDRFSRHLEYLKLKGWRDPLYGGKMLRRYTIWLSRFQEKRSSRKISFDRFEPAEKYFLFPMHVEPELALLLFAPFFTDQISVIKNIAQSLPVDTLLYIKENKLMLGKRAPDFYQRIKSIPNVKLVDPAVSSSEMIKSSEGVITITGTTGMEAAIMGKPTVVLGHPYYEFMEGVVQCSDYERLPSLIAELKSYTPDEKSIRSFVAAVVDNSIEVDLTTLAKNIYDGVNNDFTDKQFNQYADVLIGEIKKANQKLSPVDSAETV